MHDNLASFEQQIDTTLLSVAEGNRTNRISVADVRNWTASYLRDHAEEMERFPELKHEMHWTLFARDAYAEDALFVLLTFSLTDFGVIVGRGERTDVHDFGLNFVGDVPLMIAAAQTRFPRLSEMIAIPLAHGYYWSEST